MNPNNPETPKNLPQNAKGNYAIQKTEAEWKTLLTTEQYHVLRRKGTEAPFTGTYNKFYKKGHYVCGACGQKLFDSDAKYDSGSGWPSFFQPVDGKAITELNDDSHGMIRTEIVCSQCGGHLGHVFDDGPQPTGLRYCVNSLSLEFVADKK